MTKKKIFFIPYAGGSAAVYARWKDYFNSHIEVITIELAGRGRRFADTMYENMEEVIEDVFRNIEPHLDGTPYAIFGHSMGAVIGFELYHRIQNEGKELPIHMFFSGREAPNQDILEEKDMKIHKLSDDAFLDRIKMYGGVEDAFFEDEDLINLFLPILRSDFSVIENYKPHSNIEKLSCGITVFNGLKDYTTKSSIEEWHNFSEAGCKIHHFDGGHFFINDYYEHIIEIIQEHIEEGIA